MTSPPTGPVGASTGEGERVQFPLALGLDTFGDVTHELYGTHVVPQVRGLLASNQPVLERS